MAKLNMICKQRPESRWKSETQRGGRRFYTSVDMSELKHMIVIRNSEIKRGLIVDKPNNYISVCGCGNEGCFILGGYDNSPKLDFPTKNKQ
jgi:hypothetical protein